LPSPAALGATRWVAWARRWTREPREQSETNRSVDRSGSDKRQKMRGKKRLTSAQSRCILWVERDQSSTWPVRCCNTEAGFLCVQVCTSIGHLLICPQLGWGTKDPQRYPITELHSQPRHPRRPIQVHRRTWRCGRRHPSARSGRRGMFDPFTGAGRVQTPFGARQLRSTPSQRHRKSPPGRRP